MNILKLIAEHTNHLTMLEDAWERAQATLETITLLDDHIHETPCLTCENAWDEGRESMNMDSIEADIKLHQGHLRLLRELSKSAPTVETTELEEW